MDRDAIVAILKKHIFPEPSANIVCDVTGFDEAAAEIQELLKFRCTICGWPVDTSAKPVFPRAKQLNNGA